MIMTARWWCCVVSVFLEEDRGRQQRRRSAAGCDDRAGVFPAVRRRVPELPRRRLPTERSELLFARHREGDAVERLLQPNPLHLRSTYVMLGLYTCDDCGRQFTARIGLVGHSRTQPTGSREWDRSSYVVLTGDSIIIIYRESFRCTRDLRGKTTMFPHPPLNSKKFPSTAPTPHHHFPHPPTEKK